MKKLAASFVIILGLSFAGFQSLAANNLEKSKISVSENPWEVFKGVIHTYKNSNVEFMYKSEAEQQAFLAAADEMKEKLSEYSDFHAEEKIKRINQAVTIFKYLWDTKELIHGENMDNEIVEIPEVK
jgi:hypothetical protein